MLRGCGIALLATNLAGAQASGDLVDWPRPEVIDPASRGITAKKEGQLVVGLRRGASTGELDLVFANPVHDFEVGEYPDGTLVVLAGGVREGLDVYLWDPVSGELQRFSTRGGSRLPEGSFGAGLGSWPVREGRHLCVFAYENGDKVHVRACGGESIVAARVLPRSVENFEIRVDERRQLVRLDFIGALGARSLSFRHPLAPRLAYPGLVRPEVRFEATTPGRPVRAGVPLRNAGARPLLGRLIVQGDAFRLTAEETSVRIAPGTTEVCTVELVADGPGEFSGWLHVESEVDCASGAVVLRGVVRDEAVERDAGAAPDNAAGELDAPAQRDGATAAEPSTRGAGPGALDPLLRGELLEINVGRTRPTVVSVFGRIDPERARPRRPGAAVSVRVRNGGATVESRLSSDGRFAVEVAAAAGDVIHFALIDRWTPEPAELALAPVRCALRHQGRDVVVCGRRLAPFLVAAFVEGAARPLRTWRGATDARGLARIPVPFFGQGRTPLNLVLAVTGADGGVDRSAALPIEPDRPRK